MATYDVEVFRVVKLTFVNIDAGSAEEAALMADAKAKDLTDCIVASNAPRATAGVETLPAGALSSVSDAHVNMRFLVNHVRHGVSHRDGRFIRSIRFAPEERALCKRATS